MNKTSHTGTAIPLRRHDIDTDQIAPTRFLPYFRQGGFTNILFADWRADPSFVLNQPVYQGATILVAGRDFGTGSSRESAVWALQSAGIQAVVASRFGDIFRGNAVTRQLWPVQVAQETVQRLWEAIEENPWLTVTLDLVQLELLFDGQAHTWELDVPLRQRLLHTTSMIEETLSYEADIIAYETQHQLPGILKRSPLAGEEA
jgi:3-isopropylmalate/(R)-2-methylmalate dehydratase small subunit